MPVRQSRKRSDDARSLVGFTVGDGHYAVEVSAVREILSPTALVAVPHAAPIVVGVADHRGRVVPVLDLRRRFGLPTAAPTVRAKWIVVDVAGEWLGLVVDDVSEVFSVSDEDERAAPRLGPDQVARGFAAVFRHGGHIVLMLDLHALARAIEEGEGGLLPARASPLEGTERESGA